MADPRQAPKIPNLLSLRGTRGGRGRGRGRGGFASPGSNNSNSEARKDEIVQNTDQDASDSRMSAVALGYLEDPFAEAFIHGPVPRRYPIINRGTYIRTTAIDNLVNKFLATDPEQPKQIISLGAGSDTRYFRLVSRNPSLKLVYHELDFPANTISKIAIIKRSPSLLKALHTHLADEGDSLQTSADGTTLHSPTYNIHPLDLRTLATNDDPTALPPLPNLSPTTPTLLLSECCLIYLPPTTADAVLTSLAAHILPSSTPLALILYEPIRPHDSFGRVMISNLAQRGIVLQTLEKYASLAAQRARLEKAGFGEGQRAADVDFIYAKWVKLEERERVARCEMLDEVEEWQMLARHYCVAWGWRGGGKEGAGGESDIFGRAWGDVVGQDDGGGG